MANLADFVRIVYFIVSNVIGSLQKLYFFLKTYIIYITKIKTGCNLIVFNEYTHVFFTQQLKNVNNKHFTYRYSIMTEAEGYKESK